MGRARQRRDAARARSIRTRAASRCTRCRRSRSTAGPSSSTAPGRRSPPRPTRRARSDGSSRDHPRPAAVRPRRRRPRRSTTQARRSPRTTSSRCYRAASRLFEDAGAPPEALVPLMTRTIENGFQLTGPIARGDWAVVDAHIGALHESRPGARADVPRAGGGDRAVKITRTDRGDPRGVGPRARSGSSRRWAPTTPATSRSSPPPARRTISWSRACSSTRRSSATRPTSPATRATRRPTPRLPRRRASTSSSRPPLEELYPPGYETWVDVDRGVARARRRLPPRPLPGRRDDLPEALQHRPARGARTSGRRTRSRSRSSAG